MCKYGLRDVCEFTVPKAKKGIKRKCISVVGVRFWNAADLNLRMCNSLLIFKQMAIKAIFESYKLK